MPNIKFLVEEICAFEIKLDEFGRD